MKAGEVRAHEQNHVALAPRLLRSVVDALPVKTSAAAQEPCNQANPSLNVIVHSRLSVAVL